jgi:RIO-like serine/threonine protein kinase
VHDIAIFIYGMSPSIAPKRVQKEITAVDKEISVGKHLHLKHGSQLKNRVHIMKFHKLMRTHHSYNVVKT